jgi:hippurate hydrolase
MRRTWRKAIFTLLVGWIWGAPILEPAPVLAANAIGSRAADKAAVEAWVDGNLERLIATYKTIHANPELSLQEEKTATLVAGALQRAGYEVTLNVGGTGVVGVIRNGPGRTLLLRGDMDALPVTEATGAAYASRVRVEQQGGSVGVMHACGHDVHTTNLIGTAQMLANLRDKWTGTLVIAGQPAEELGKGAKMMIEDGLFDRFPRPDMTLALHVSHDLPAGTVGYTPGWSAANVDSVDITIFGRGGHGARPHESVDPIVATAHLVISLQTLVSRRVDPTEPAVVTVGSIHGGSKHNVIPDEVRLQLTVRSYTDDVRQQLLAGIRQIANDTCVTFRCPQEPLVAVKDEFTPAMYNDPQLTAAAVDVFRSVLGAENVVEKKAEMGGEDFGRYARALQVPGFMYRLGAVHRKAYRASLKEGSPPLPPVHSSRFLPDPEPTLRTGLESMGNLALALLAPKGTPGSAP